MFARAEPPATLGTRLSRLRNKQDNAFVSIFLHRPLAIGLLLVVADVPWITPNRLTTLGVTLRAAAALALWPASWGGLSEGTAKIAAVLALVHLGAILDCADGALARYRGVSSLFGRYYDKIADRLVTLLLMSSICAQAFVQTGRVRFVFFGMAAAILWSATSVAKWIHLGILSEVEGGKAPRDPVERPAPVRDALGWAKYLFVSTYHLFAISELELPLWLSVGLLAGRMDLLLWLLGLGAVPQSLVMLVRRGWEIRALESTRRAS